MMDFKESPKRTFSVQEKYTVCAPKSRTKQKKDDHGRQIIGERLVGLSENELDRVPLPDEILEAVSLAAKTTAHGARRRQIKYIGALLRRIDSSPVEKALDVIAKGDYEKKAVFKKLETWRDILRTGNIDLINDILAECPLADRQKLMQLTRNAVKEFEGNKETKASKALFRYLKEVLENQS